MRKSLFALTALLLLLPILHAQSFTTSPCSNDEGHTTNDLWFLGHQERVCELRRTVLPSRAELKVSARNGGIEVIGQDRRDIALEARVIGVASTRDEAQSIAHQVKIDLGDTIHADGPNSSGWSRRDWYVNYRLFVPRHLAAQFHTVNGGIDLSGLDGTANADTTNGGISLRDLAGEVHARTINGGISAALSGDRWRGAGLFADTTNGGISVGLPGRYSAHLIAETSNGNVSVAIPMSAEKTTGKRIDTNLGSGGATVQFQTVNGGVTIDHHTSADDRE
ncbi:MAG TPA: DUF4097 family beta strand repeat-containing protein [Acidobacteriaceae bacterium]|jgi:hypothetical protein|nr:DUF4097 family beta strand repeat-containing protein [Acidobacteriaceae bacterium]